MKSSIFLASTAVVLLFSAPYASAVDDPIAITFEITDRPAAGSVAPYYGVAYDYAMNGLSDVFSLFGAVQDMRVEKTSTGDFIADQTYGEYGQIGAFPDGDAGTAYALKFNGLGANRRTETYATDNALSPTAIRWFDSFTNRTSASITTNIRFYAALSDAASKAVIEQQPGYLITADRLTGATKSATVLHLYSDANYANQVTITQSPVPDSEFTFDYTIEVGSGKTVSIMVVNYIFADLDRLTDPTGAAEREKQNAMSMATSFINSPIFTGLTADQIATIVNFGSVKLDGSLPSAGASARLAGNSLSLLNNLLDINRSFSAAGTQLGNDNFAPMAYVPLTKSDDSSEAAAQIANLIGQYGGSLRHGDDHHELFMLGGYTRGSDKSLSDEMRYDGYALAMGYEFAADNASQYGLIAGYMNTSGKLGDRYSDISGEQFVLSPYARWSLDGGIALDARMSLSSDNWSYIRTAGALDATADYDGYSAGASLQASKAFETSSITITPFAKLSFLHSHFNGYEEQGAGTANLEVPSYRTNAAEVFGGIGFSDNRLLDNNQRLTAFANIGLGRGFGQDREISTRYAGSSLSYATLIDGNDDTFARLDLGTSLQLSHKTNLSMSYSGNFTENASQHSLSSKLTVKF